VAEVCLTCAHNGFVRPTIVEVLYSALVRTIEPEFVPCCRRYGLEIVVYNPLAGGLLSGKIKTRDHIPDAGRFSNVTGAGSFYRSRYYRESTFNALKIIADAVDKDQVDNGSSLTMPEAALRWVVYHSALKTGDAGRDGVILGVSSVEQLENNIDSIERGPLPESVVEAFERAWEVSRADVCCYWHPDDIEYTYDTQAAVFGAGAAA
jgi:aflatoxin B1 aldehyde reductase